MTTAPVIEWLFVADPERESVLWPVETRIDAPENKRERLPLAELRKRREERNQQLRALKEPELLEAECLGARLHTGPMCATGHFLAPQHSFVRVPTASDSSE